MPLGRLLFGQKILAYMFLNLHLDNMFHLRSSTLSLALPRSLSFFHFRILQCSVVRVNVDPLTKHTRYKSPLCSSKKLENSKFRGWGGHVRTSLSLSLSPLLLFSLYSLYSRVMSPLTIVNSNAIGRQGRLVDRLPRL